MVLLMTWHWLPSCILLLLHTTIASYPGPNSTPSRYGQPRPKTSSGYGKSLKSKFLPAEPGETPSCVKNPRLTFCTDPDDYPKKHITYLLQNNMFDLGSMIMDETRDTYTFESREVPQPPAKMYTYQTPKGYLPPSLNLSRPYNYNPSQYGQHVPVTHGRYKRQAFSGPDGDNPEGLCPSRSDYVMPRAAQNIQGEWMFLVNIEEVNPRYTQLVKSETCVTNTCSGSCQAPPGTTAVCQQQFVQKRLVALAGSGESLNQDIFWFPSCCVCKIRRT